MSNYRTQSAAARFEKVGRESYKRVKKAAAATWIRTVRVAQRVRRVASTFMSSTGLKSVYRRRRRSAASAVPFATSPDTSPSSRDPPPAAEEASPESSARQRRCGLPIPHPPVVPLPHSSPRRFFFRRSMRGWKAAFGLRKPSSSEATTRSYFPHSIASSAAISRAATSAYAVFCASAPVAPVDSPSAPSAASAASSASSANPAGANQSASSTSPSVSACFSLTGNASYSSSSAPSFPARSTTHADLRAGPTPAAIFAAIPALAPTASVKIDSYAISHANPVADCRGATCSSSWRRAMAIAIPAGDGDDQVGEDEGGEVGEPGGGEPGEGPGETAGLAAAEAAEELAESDGLSGGAPVSAVDIDSLWESAAAAELEEEEQAVTAAAIAAASAAAGAKRWRGSWKALTPRSNAAPKTPRSDFYGSKKPAQIPVFTPRGLVEPKKVWGALAESVASALADSLSGAEMADGAAGLSAPTIPRLSFRRWRSTAESPRPRASGVAEVEFAEEPLNWLERAGSGGIAVSAASPPPPFTPRFLSALRSSSKRSAADAAAVVVASSNSSGNASSVVSSSLPSSSRMVPELSWGQLSELATGKERRDRAVVERGHQAVLVRGDAVEGGVVQEEAVEWCVVEDNAWEEPDSPAMTQTADSSPRHGGCGSKVKGKVAPGASLSGCPR
ncbi:unnamed protein product [Closterium sp. Naga37s-1]|nr:unnamed protein product [Closterium sp. Naga37s-1]